MSLELLSFKNANKEYKSEINISLTLHICHAKKKLTDYQTNPKKIWDHLEVRTICKCYRDIPMILTEVAPSGTHQIMS